MGFHFCLFYTADAALRDVDKPLVAYFAGPAAAGLYTAAYRIVDAAAMPMRAVIASIYARFFVHGNKGIDSSIGFAFKVLPILLGYCLFLGIFLAAGSQLLPLILGDKFAASAPLIGRLAILPFFGALTSIGGNILTSTGRQRTRALVVLVLSFSPVVLCSILVPRFGLDGAAAAAVLNAVLFATATWAMVNFSRNAEHRRMAHAKA
jgi:O-antigen/teichoic acid export membrane protein